MKIGYVRISTKEQNTARQDILMEQLHVDKVYTDKISGKNTDRPQLQEMINFVREGNMVIVESISRFARNTKDLLELTEQLEKKMCSLSARKRTSTPAHQQESLCCPSLGHWHSLSGKIYWSVKPRG